MSNNMTINENRGLFLFCIIFPPKQLNYDFFVMFLLYYFKNVQFKQHLKIYTMQVIQKFCVN
ncbi:hypothetical protein BLOT_000069 [Blomia tropicalis]|nr:hypothetical protein BLOT_000069 [Blomia tropicalis]